MDFDSMLDIAKKMVKELVDTKKMSKEELVKVLGLEVKRQDALIGALIKDLEDLRDSICDYDDIRDELEGVVCVDEYLGIEFANGLDLDSEIDEVVDDFGLMSADEVKDEITYKSLEDIYDYLRDVDNLSAYLFIGDDYEIRNIAIDDYQGAIKTLIDSIKKARDYVEPSSKDDGNEETGC